MKYVIFVLTFIFLIGLASAESFDILYNTDYNLKQPCKLNGNDCPNDVECRLSIFYPNMSLLSDNSQMDYNVGYFNYSINGTELNELGNYKSIMTCNNSAYNNSYVFFLDVSKKQVLNSNDNFVSESRVITILIALIIIFIALGVYFNIKDSQIRYLFFLLAIVFIDALTYFGYTIVETINSKFANVMYRIYYVMLFITFFIFVLMLIDMMRKYLSWKKGKEKKAKDYYGELN